MKYKLIIIRFGEIALKGKATRRYFENILVRNIKTALNIKNIPKVILVPIWDIFVTIFWDIFWDIKKRLLGITA